MDLFDAPLIIQSYDDRPKYRIYTRYDAHTAYESKKIAESLTPQQKKQLQYVMMWAHFEVKRENY